MNTNCVIRSIRSSTMTAATTLMLIIAGCSGKPESGSETSAAGNRVGQLRGIVAINQAIKDRMLDPSSTSTPYFSVGTYIGHNGQNVEGIAAILGGFSGVGPANKFRNGQPNAMNILLWDRALSGYAKTISLTCLAPNIISLPLSAAMQTTVTRLCAWPADDAKKAMDEFWNLAMGLNDFDQEREEWKQFFQDAASPYKDAPAPETLEAMARAVFLHPFFLLEM